jgi:hypothetical protein
VSRIELDLIEQPGTSMNVLVRIGLPLHAGMTRDEVAVATGCPPTQDPEVPWGTWYRLGRRASAYTVQGAFRPHLSYVVIEPDTAPKKRPRPRKG